MRPKLIALVAVSAVALVGCAAGEPSVEPTATVTVTATPEAEPALPAEPEDMFVNALSSTFEGNESKISKSVRYKMEDSYYVDRGEEYCEQIDAGKKVEPMVDTALDNDYEIENRIMLNAQTFLCPQN